MEQRYFEKRVGSGFLKLGAEDKRRLPDGVAQLLSEYPLYITKYTLPSGYEYVVGSRRLGVVMSGSSLDEAKAAFLLKLKQTEE